MVYVYCDGRGNLRAAKTPPLQSGVCGDIVAGDCRTDHHLRPCGHLREGGKANHDAACRVVVKTTGSWGMRDAMVRVWRRQWATFGRIAMLGARRGVLERDAARHVATNARPLPPARSRMPCAPCGKNRPTPRGHRPAGYSPSRGSPGTLPSRRGSGDAPAPPRSINQSQ